MAVKYPEIKESILSKVKEGVYTQGQMLPPERELTALFNASRMTVRRALDELIQEGILIRKSGSGVFVAKEKLTRSSQRVSIHSDQEIAQKYGVNRVKVISLKTVTNHVVSNRLLQLESDQEVWQLKRVQYAGKTPIVYENIFLPKAYFKDLEKVDCSVSMSQIVEQTILIKDRKEERKIEVEAVLASTNLAKYLEISKDSPILQMNIIIYHQGKPIYCGKDSYDGNSFRYQNE